MTFRECTTTSDERDTENYEANDDDEGSCGKAFACVVQVVCIKSMHDTSSNKQ